ncbi:M3 family oligoendopeptidase [Paenisporosarcina sp. TG20]|uniref:M3 family oligoendopeptidase n=1 Tax=Paenisporosarcina sp. TG20 TaxID=1211706 RepID=UPI0002EA6A38|nr:M3 family oligoendopeptidase [Paenisporosarcina sp. TG20]
MEQIISKNRDLDTLYAGGSQSDQLKKVMEQLTIKIKALTNELQLFNERKVTSNTQHLLDILKDTQNVISGWEEVDDYLICVYAQNVKDTEAKNLMAESSVIKSKLTSFQAELDQTLASLDEQTWFEFCQQKEVEPFSFYLEERRQSVKDLLPLEMEKMISALSVNGFNGWEKHHEQILTQLKIPLEVDGEEKKVSIGHALNQAMFSSDRSLRQKAANAIEQVLETNADTFASVLNRVAGFRLDVYQQRGWQNLLKEMVKQNRIEEETIYTMVSTIKQNRNLIRTFIERKIKVDKLEAPAWYDFQAPSFKTEEKVSYEKAVSIVVEQFYGFSEKLGNFADKAFKDGWIEVENRPDKAEGGFCASMPLAKESRIFLTFRENYQDVVTIAHELGHAYHNYILHEQPAFVQDKGTSVAETASTFMENLVLDAAIDQSVNEMERLALLEMKITNGLKYVIMVPNMFEFELKFYEKRKKGLLTTEEIKNLIIEVENDVYGGLIEDLDPYKWMYISHFYDTEKAFYNIPYTIGYLFSNGIYALAKEKDGGFIKQFDELLRNSGRMTVEHLAEEFLGKDIKKKDFWEASLVPLREAIEEYLRLTDKMV